MRRLLQRFAETAREPSTWAGVGVLALAAGVPAVEWLWWSELLALGAGVASVLLRERAS